MRLTTFAGFSALLVSAAALGQWAPAQVPSGGAVRTIAVTIDDLPINGADPGLAALTTLNDRLLAAVKRQGVPAVGFVNESKLYQPGEVDGRIALLKAWLDQGLELGNHTFSHSSFDKVGLSAFLDDVVRGETVTRWLQEARGQKMGFFRHPFLMRGRPWKTRLLSSGPWPPAVTASPPSPSMPGTGTSRTATRWPSGAATPG